MHLAEEAPKKKHVRFARMEEARDRDERDEDTLFDKRTEVKSGLKSALKKGARHLSLEKVEIVRPGWGQRDAAAAGWRWLVSLALCASFLGLGMAISVLGPTFEDLALNVNKNISHLSYIFVGRSSGYIGGSLLGGILFDFVNPHLLLGFSLLTTALGMAGTPFCKTAWLLTALMSSVGVSMGILDTGGNVLILNTWGDGAGPHLQALHFSFAVGAFASPIIAKLLFGHSSDNDTLLSSGHISKATLKFYSNGIALTSMWAYIVIGIFVLLVSLLFLILYFCSSPNTSKSKTSTGQLFSRHHTTLVLLLSVFFFFYVGSEVAYGSFIFTYAKNYAGMTIARAAALNSLFWGMFAVGRGMAVFFATCLPPGTLILLCLVGTTFSSLILLLFSTSPLVLWSCTALYGISMSTTFPSGIAWVEQYTTVTGRSAAVFVVGAALGEMVLPALMGLLMEKMPSHPLLMYLALGTSTFTSILFPVMYKLASSKGDGSLTKVRGTCTKETDDSEFRQSLLGEEEEEEGQDDDEEYSWNETDFEVIEMDNTGLESSRSKAASPRDHPFTPPPHSTLHSFQTNSSFPQDTNT